MSGYEWAGGIANGGFQRAGSRIRNVPGDAERGVRLFRQLAGAIFYHERCGGSHPLAEHRKCKQTHWKAGR